MALNPEWLPMRWPGSWAEPAMLDLLKDTPFDCLVASARPVVDRARKAGLAVVRIGERAAGGGEAGPVIPVAPRSSVAHAPSSPIVAFTENVWPSIKLSAKEDRDVADTGPTGMPWVESNGWFVRMARALAPGRTIWIVADPPEEKSLRRAEFYALAVSDAAAYGGRWVVSLDNELAAGVASGNREALAAWKKISAAAAFHKRQAAWADFRPFGVLGVLSDFAGDNEFTATEAVNLINRRNLGFHILNRTRGAELSLEGLKAVLYLDRQAPEGALRGKLLAFVRGGGLVVGAPSCMTLTEGAKPSDQTHVRFRLWTLGSGRIAIAKEEFADPYVLASDTHVLLSRRHDLLRVWNGSPAITYYAGSPDGRRAVVHILNYSAQPVEFMSVRVMQPYRSARLWTAGGEPPAPLKVIPADGEAEFHLPPVGPYAAIELEA
ncbi:MAG TPA: hypothetical protein VLE22_12330 [Bryobacteraceae bacterium]|nr:hypothetical protein [Bryobacteraceae bacterium]